MSLDLELLPKIITPSEEKELKVFLNYLMFDIFSDKVSYPIFKERMEILNVVRKFDLLKIFKELCGENHKYLTLPRLAAAYMKYETNDKNTSTELKNFMAFVINDLVFDYSQKSLGCITKSMKEFSTKNHANRNSLTNIKVYTNKQNEIVGLHFEYDEKYPATFIAPKSQDDDYELKINCNLKINSDFLEEDENEEDAEYARDYITHIYGTYTNVIESLGFKSAFGKHYFCGKPTKGKQFLMGTTKSRFHYVKLGMDSRLNTINFKFKPALFNPNVNRKLKDLTEEDYEDVYPDELVLQDMEDDEHKDKMIMTPYLFEKEIGGEYDSDEDDWSGDSIDEICHSEGCLSDLEDMDSEEEDKMFHELIEEIEDEEVKKELQVIHAERHRVQKAKTFAEDKKTAFDKIQKITGQEKKTKKIKPEEFRKYCAKDIFISDLINNPEVVDQFVDRYQRILRDEIEEQITLREKVNSMKNDFYIKYLNRNKTPKDWEIYEKKIKADFDPFVLQKEIGALIKSNEEYKEITDHDIPASAYDKFELEEDEVRRQWTKFGSYLSRKFSLVFLRESLLTVAKNVMSAYEAGQDLENFSIKDKVTLFKQILKLKRDKKLISFSKRDEPQKPKKNFNLSLLEEVKNNKAEGKDKKEKPKIPSSTKSETNVKRAKSEVIVKGKSDTIASYKKKANVPLTDDDVAKIYKKNIRDIKANIHEYYEANKRQLEKYNIMINKRQVSDDRNEKFFNKLEQLKKLKEWFIKTEVAIHKEKMQKKTDVDLDKIKDQELEKRKKILNQNKSQKLDEKKQAEEELQAKIKDPVSTGELIKSNKDIRIYRQQQLPEKNQRFVDDKFKPIIESLCPYDESKQAFILPPDAYEDDVIDWETFEWSKFEDIFKTTNYQVFLDKIEEGDIIQGGLGDCYFLSAIAALTKFPELIKKLFLFQERSSEGCYGVNYRVNGEWKCILVDESIPSTGGYRPDFVFSATNDKELWVVLLEKAWAKLCGNYIRSVGGLPSEVFDCVTNSMSENINISPGSADLIWSKLKIGKEKNFIMTAGTGGNPNLDYEEVGLMTGHAYTVLDSAEFYNNGILTKLVKLRNPWGNTEFSGDWSDNSTLWTDKLKKELKVSEEDDGVFYMHFDDFIKYYVIFSMCHLYPDYHHNFVKFPWEKTTKPNVTEMKLEQDSKVFIQLHQKNTRFVLPDGSYPKNSYCFIMVLDDKYNFIKSSSSDYNVESIECDLKKGTYYIVSDVSYRYINKDKLHSYCVTSISENEAQFYSTELDYIDVIKKGMINFSKENLSTDIYPGTNELGGVEYATYAKTGTTFPYIFMYVNNQTNCDVSAYLNLKRKTDCEFLDMGTSNVERDIIKPGEADVIVVRKFYPTSRFEYSTGINVIYSDDQLTSICEKKGKSEDLNKSVRVKVYQYESGVGLVFLNSDKKATNMKVQFSLNNLAISGSESNELSFALKDKKFVHLKAIDLSAGFGYGYSYSIE